MTVTSDLLNRRNGRPNPRMTATINSAPTIANGAKTAGRPRSMPNQVAIIHARKVAPIAAATKRPAAISVSRRKKRVRGEWR
jgi:hypothetical protein